MRRLACCAWLGMVSSCARLPEVPTGECGNGVIEAPEDCDGFGVDGGAACLPKGAVGECHFDCARESDGIRPTCPSGWGCDASGICRRPTGSFAALREYEVGSAARLMPGDFDGDGRADVASLEPPDRIGGTRMRFHYFDERAELRETRDFSRFVLGPSVDDLSRDDRSDVLFSDFRVGVLLGRTDRNWVPETFASYRMLDTSVRTVGIFSGSIQNASGFVVFATLDGVPGVYVPDGANEGMPRLLAQLASANDDLIGDPVQGHVIEDRVASPCAQVVIAARGDDRFSFLDLCTTNPATGVVEWQTGKIRSIALDPAAPVDAAPLIVDLNADGHLDVLIGAAGRAYAAYGDGATLSTASPYRLPLPDTSMAPREMRMPLAAADLTKDGVIDFIFDDHGLFSAPAQQPGRNEYFRSAESAPGFMALAAIADFNDNGHADLVAASPERTGIIFFNGSSDGFLTEFFIPTPRPVRHLAVGDFDGDFVRDLAFTQVGADGVEADTVLIAFGTTAGPPLPPTQVARLPRIEQIAVYRELAVDHLILASRADLPDRRRGALALLAGGGGSLPVAFYEITRFAEDGSTLGSAALRSVSGRFSGGADADVLALAVQSTRPLDNQLEFWLLPSLMVGDGTPVPLEGALPPHLHAVAGTGSSATMRVSLAVLDADADGRDEVALAMPAEDDERCGLVVLGLEGTRIAVRASSVVSEPCTSVELRALDADGDAAVDLVLLNGREQFTEAQLAVWWNDGTGAFVPARRSIIADSGVSPRAFAALPATPARAPSFAYATDSELRFAAKSDTGLDFAELAETLPVANCTGMASADLDGDGAVDLALATSGNLSVLKALLENL